MTYVGVASTPMKTVIEHFIAIKNGNKHLRIDKKETVREAKLYIFVLVLHCCRYNSPNNLFQATSLTHQDY